ncbi:CoA transferase [Sphingomonas gilva]|uniref:CoA transferase n=1 Tax=Sphingomonas gilva TaxID=2305907 RepID=A0A396S781_9SPHN|nr:CoA transferase [Sphingomonas gilva]RHW19255.1 CoA transferase [Sphingomonas gilva]
MVEGAAGPLAGVRILDLTRALAGPFATLLLGGLGAQIVRIEEPKGDGRENAPFLGRDGASLKRLHDDDVAIGHLIRHRGKRSITLNLKHPEAKGIFARLVPHFDVVVENYTRGTAERLGVGYTAARAAREDIVYCSISGFGQEGAPGGGKAMDGIIQAMSGIMLTSGDEGDAPVRIGVPFADLNTPLFAVIGIVSALFHHARTGEGQHIDVSMLGALSALQASEPFKLLEELGIPMRTGATVPRLTPFGVYPASDGDVVICCSGDRNFKRLAIAMDRVDLEHDPRFETQVARIHHYRELDAIVGGWTRARGREEVIARLEAEGIAAAPVRSPDEANRDPRVLARGEVIELAHPVHGRTAEVFGPGVPIVFSATPARMAAAGAPLGADNQAIYGDMLGLGEDAIARLRAEQAI